MLRPITVQRATVGNGVLEPVQCSQNLQIAINNSDHLTIFELKLPLLHQAVSSVLVNGKNQKILDLNALYDVCTTFRIESVESLGLQIFSRVLIEDGESSFSFGRIGEPTIVEHLWSPLDETTRDCYLGLLLNTGEVLVLKRDSLDADAYEVHFRSFTCLLDQMNIELERLTPEGDIILRNQQYLELKVTGFVFTTLPNGSLAMTLAHESGEISIHKLEQGLPLIERFQAGGLVVKQSWSQLTNHLYYVLSDNSVHVVPIDDNGRLRSPPVSLKDPSRFTISQLKCSNTGKYAVVVDTCSIYYLSESAILASEKLPFRAVVSSLPIIETPLKISVCVCYETGRMCVAQLDQGQISISGAPGAWNNFVNRSLYKYQLLIAKDRERAPSKTFQNFLTGTAEGNFTNFGTQLISSNGMLVTVYNISPRNTIHYETRSQMEFTLSFLPVKEIDPEYVLAPEARSTSLSTINALLLDDIDNLPAISGEVVEGNPDATKAFLESLSSWKLKSFIDPKAAKLDIEPFITLEEGLINDFRDNTTVTKLQTLYTMNSSLLRTLNALSTSGKAADTVGEAIIVLAQEQDLVTLRIRQHLSRIFMQYLKGHSPSKFQQDIDRFMLLNYYIILKSAEDEVDDDKILEEVKITISTDICTESFQLSKNAPVPTDFLKFLNSTTNHKWARCDLTFIPLLELQGKSDELELHNYSTYQDLGSELFSVLFDTLGYCVYSGNRIFNTKVGV